MSDEERREQEDAAADDAVDRLLEERAFDPKEPVWPFDAEWYAELREEHDGRNR